MRDIDEKVKILIVDDRPENLFSLEAILDDDDREIVQASSGNEALKLAIKNEFALILSDVQMPGMDGFEMVEILRSNPKNKFVPVIFVTAISKEEQYVHQGYSEGAVDYLFKPLDPTVVKSKTDIFVSLYKQKMRLKSQKKELLHLNKEKNHFIGMAAHDLRNPLGVVQYFSKFLMDDNVDHFDAEVLEHLEIIHSTSNFMMNMVNELLDLTKIESGTFTLNKESVTIKVLVEQAVKINQIVAKRKDIELSFEVSDDVPNCMLDYGKMTQVLNNLIGNAIKYSNPNSAASVKAWKEGEFIKISVIDNGQGIPPSEIRKLFQPFQTTSVQSTGGEKSTGLGLTIVAKMVEAHEGQISVESEVGKGSAFTVSLPIIKSIEVPIQAKSISTSYSDGRGRREILVCEDNVMLQLLMKNVLQVFDVKVHFAENGEVGLQTLKAHPEIDLVFTDVHMPVMGGIELLDEINKMGLEIDVVVLTASLNEEIIQKTKASGSDYCVEKPISRSLLEGLLEHRKAS